MEKIWNLGTTIGTLQLLASHFPFCKMPQMLKVHLVKAKLDQWTFFKSLILSLEHLRNLVPQFGPMDTEDKW